MTGASVVRVRAAIRQLHRHVYRWPHPRLRGRHVCRCIVSPPSNWFRCMTGRRRFPGSRPAASSPASSVPALVRLTHDHTMPIYVATYAGIVGLHAIVFTIMSFIRFPSMQESDRRGGYVGGGPAAATLAGDCLAAALHRRRAGRYGRVRHHVVPDERLAAGDRRMRTAAHRGASGDLPACARHVRAGSLYRQPDRPFMARPGSWPAALPSPWWGWLSVSAA